MLILGNQDGAFSVTNILVERNLIVGVTAADPNVGYAIQVRYSYTRNFVTTNFVSINYFKKYILSNIGNARSGVTIKYYTNINFYR